MGRSEYVGRAQWAVLRVLCDAPDDGLMIAELTEAVRPEMHSNRPAAVIESLMVGGLIEHACPPYDHDQVRWCKVRITERGENARLNARGRRDLAYGR